MDFEQLEAFLSVAQTKSFTRTAEKLHIAQSTVTMRIKALEEELGYPLFDRDSRRVELNEAGRTFLTYAQRMMELRIEGMRMIHMHGRFAGRLVVGSLNSLWDYVLFPVINDFRKNHPQIALRLFTGHSSDVIRRVQDGIVDVGIVYMPPHHPDIDVIPIYEDSIHLVGHPSLSIPKLPVTAEDLHSLPFIHMNWGGPFARWFEKEVGKNYYPPFQVDETTLFVKFLQSGEGIGFLLKSVSKELVEQGRLKVLPFHSDSPIPTRTTHLIYHKRKTNDPAVQTWINHMRKWGKELDWTFPV